MSKDRAGNGIENDIRISFTVGASYTVSCWKALCGGGNKILVYTSHNAVRFSNYNMNIIILSIYPFYNIYIYTQ